MLEHIKQHPKRSTIGEEETERIETLSLELQRLEFFGPDPGDDEVLAEVHSDLQILNSHLRPAQVDDDWQDPHNLPPATPPVPNLTPDMIPEPFRAWITDAAERLSVHPEMVAVPAIVAAAAAIGRSVGIYPKAEDDSWLEPANLWGVIIARPSSRKSPAISEGTAHLKRLQSELLDQYKQEQTERDVKAQIIELEINKLKREASGKNGNPASIESDLLEKTQALAELDIPERRIVVNDSTVEKLGELLRDNPRGLLYQRDELAGLLASTEKPGREGDRAFLLEAWNGNGSYSFDRITRGTLHIEAVNLSLIGGTQSDKFKPYIQGAMAGSTQADGLLQRFQMTIWPDRAPDWVRVDRKADEDARKRAYQVFEALINLDPLEVGAIEDRAGQIPALHFTSEAQEAFNLWFDDLMEEAQSVALDQAPAYQAHLSKYQTLVARLALAFQLIAVVDGQAPGGVSHDAVDLAIRWADFLKAHARKMYVGELNTDVKTARTIAELIEAGDLTDGIKVRDIYKGRSLGNAEEVLRALTILSEVHWLKIEEKPNEGARPSKLIRLNPQFSLNR